MRLSRLDWIVKMHFSDGTVRSYVFTFSSIVSNDCCSQMDRGSALLDSEQRPGKNYRRGWLGTAQRTISHSPAMGAAILRNVSIIITLEIKLINYQAPKAAHVHCGARASSLLRYTAKSERAVRTGPSTLPVVLMYCDRWTGENFVPPTDPDKCETQLKEYIQKSCRFDLYNESTSVPRPICCTYCNLQARCSASIWTCWWTKNSSPRTRIATWIRVSSIWTITWTPSCLNLTTSKTFCSVRSRR